MPIAKDGWFSAATRNMLLLTFQYLTEAKGGQQKIWLVFGSHWLVDWLVGWLDGWLV